MSTDDVGSAPTMVGSTEPSPSTSPPQVIAGRYEILALLGAGGMGRVYRAHDRMLDEVVALKMLRRELLDSPGAVERFRQEVKLARRVTSPHVVRTFDLGEHGDEHFLTMEFIDGRSLAQILDEGALAFDECLRIARGATAGIAAAHANGVLHRDLKPDNVLVATAGRIVITDFGIACATTSPVATGERFVGTPAYMAPEQVEGGAEIGPACDVYALGAMLYEMLTRRRPFPGNDPIQVAIARLRQPPPDPRAVRPVPAALADIAMKCMAQAPRDRFGDGGELATALAAVSDLAAPAQPARLEALVPAKSSRAVAILPLRASGELAEVADGLAEEIVDALTMTRALRVRPLASVRKLAAAGAEPREVGAALGVDVVVDGTVRRRGDQVRISARVIGVADGFQLWASHFDSRPNDLLSATDDVVRAVARALTVDLELPARAAVDQRATSLYLEAKAKLRSRWLDGTLTDIIAILEEARALAPHDPSILATLSSALSREAFYGEGDHRLAEARRLAEHAIALAPGSGDAHLALGMACLYAASFADAARELTIAVTCAPGFATAHALLGGLLLEAGELDLAIAHLEAAKSLDPLSSAHVDLPRAYVFAGRWDDAMREYDTPRPQAGPFDRTFGELTRSRFHMWRGELRPIDATAAPAHAPEHMHTFLRIAMEIHATGRFPPEARAAVEQQIDESSPRMRGSRAQFLTEFLVFTGDHDRAAHWLAYGVHAGLQDHLWMQKCPLLEPLRSRPEFAALADTVAARARAVLAAVRDAKAAVSPPRTP